MPPRRSSRTRTSVEPVSVDQVAPKRKRGQSSQPLDAPQEEKENVAGRSTSTKPTKTRSRVSTRSRISLQDVPESDNEESPPAKKTRPSVEASDVKEEAEIEEMKSRNRGRKAKSKRTVAEYENIKTEDVTPIEATKLIVIDDDEDDHEAEKVKDVEPARISQPTAARSQRVPEIDEDLTEEPVENRTEKPAFVSIPLSQPQAGLEEPQGPKPRLVIHKLALVNFKSYAGRQEIGPFHKSFSAIVGPNGSGKSNTIDALLFVFGYRATKMRQGKLSELIHNSARYPDLDECSVEIYFREIMDLPGPDAHKTVPNSQLVVTRHAYKNNASKYTINGRASNYKEVQTLLKGRGIDLDHKRFLILQGEVESIAQMKPKGTEHDDGLLEYLEDIIGTSKYKEPIEEALIEVERLQEERAEKMNRLRLVEKEKAALEERRREAVEYLKLQNEHVKALSRLWQWYLWRCLIHEDELQTKINKFKRDLDELREQNKDDLAHFDMLTEHYSKREKAYEEVRDAAAEAVKDLAAQEKEEVGLTERRKHASSKAKKLKKSLQDDKTSRTQAERLIEDSSEKIQKEKRNLEDHEASLVKEEKALEAIRDSLKDKTQVFHDQIEAKQKELQPWIAKINAKQAEIDVASGELDALNKRVKEVKEATRTAQEALDQLQSDQVSKESELENLTHKKANLHKEIKEYDKGVKDLQAKVEDLRRKASAARNRVDEAKASQVASTSQGRVLDGLTRLQAQGRIDGFHGRLGGLGTIPDKYDVAISTACPALNNLVVDKVQQAQQCIQYLRSQNLGRASFLVLDKLQRTPGMEKISTPENVPRLFDLIKFKDPRFAPAFYKVLRDTLVADDLDQANRIAYGQRRWRVVTLTGQLIDLSGTMAGGGTTMTKGLMSSKPTPDAVRPETLRQYERESEEAARLLNEILQELRMAETRHEELARSGPQISMNIDKLELDIANGRRRISEAEKRLRDLKSRSKPDTEVTARINELNQEIAGWTQSQEKLREKAGKIEQAIQDLEKKILDIGGSRLLTQKSKVDGLRLHINLANDEITKAEVNKAKGEKDLAKLNASIEANTASLKEAEDELQELDAQLGRVSTYVNQLKGKVEAAQAAADNSKEDLRTLRAELDAKSDKIQAFRQNELEIQQKLTDAQKEFKENARALEHWQQEHDKLQLEEIDDDEDEDENEDDNPGEPPKPSLEPEATTAAESEDGVKAEPNDKHSKKPKRRAKTPSDELHMYSTEELAGFKKRDLIGDAEYLDEKLKNAKPDLNVLEEYKTREEEFLNRAKDLEVITTQRDDQKQQYDSLRKQRLDEFMAGFNVISLKLKEMYQMITLGGNAELELVDSMDPFSEGVIFSVMPPKKSWKNISNLSGGEKTLSSLALVFALHVFKPTPLYFMDEIDAALDFRNVSIVANYIKDRTKNAQFIIISLRNDMFELSHRLIGIYKTSNATRSISIDNLALAKSSAPAVVAA